MAGQFHEEDVVVPPGVDIPPIVQALPDSENQLKKYLHDTGSSYNFRRLTRVRHISMPGNPIEKLEVLLLPHERLDAHMSFAEEDDDDQRLIIESVVNGGFAHLNNLRRGHRLAKVGDLEAEGDFATSADRLLRVLTNRRDIVKITFESSRYGMPDESDRMRASAFALKRSSAEKTRVTDAARLEKMGEPHSPADATPLCPCPYCTKPLVPAPHPGAHPFEAPQPPQVEPPNLVAKAPSTAPPQLVPRLNLNGGPMPPQYEQFPAPQPPPIQHPTSARPTEASWYNPKQRYSSEGVF